MHIKITIIKQNQLRSRDRLFILDYILNSNILSITYLLNQIWTFINNDNSLKSNLDIEKRMP